MKPETKFIVFIVILLAILVATFWKTSCVSVKIYNQQHNTSYSCSDYFWAKDQINEN